MRSTNPGMSSWARQHLASGDPRISLENTPFQIVYNYIITSQLKEPLGEPVGTPMHRNSRPSNPSLHPKTPQTWPFVCTVSLASWKFIDFYVTTYR